MKLALIALLLFTISCGNPTVSTPIPPNSPQTQANNLNQTFADSLRTLARVTIAARDQGKMSREATRKIQDWIVPTTKVSDQIEREITSGPWEVQKGKVLTLLLTIKFPLPSPLDSTVLTALTAVSTTVDLLRRQASQ